MKQYLLYLNQLRLYLSKKGRERLSLLARQVLARPRLAQVAQKLNLQPRYRVNLGHPGRVAILLVGCGGTGGFVAHILAQLADWAASAGMDLRLYFIDPDRVEEKNLVRQNFCRAEIGYPKAFSLAWRYMAAFGLNIIPVVEAFSADMIERYRPAYSAHGSLTIVVGAVDNVHARRDIAAAVTAWLQDPQHRRHKLWWIDAGNERVNGQVLAGNSLEQTPLLSPLGYCTGLPLPHLQEPSLLQDRPEPPADDNLSCAELTLLAEQSVMINRAMATWLGVYLYRLLQSRDLDLMASYINLRTGVTRSQPISSGRMVMPPRPERPPRPQVVDEYTCPACGEGELIEGQDYWLGARINVRFCDHCAYRDEGCPQCWSDLEIGEAEIEGELAPVVRCLECDWQEPIPEAVQHGHHDNNG